MPATLPFEVAHSALGQQWQLREADEAEAKKLSQRLRCPEIVGRILAARGVTDATADAYLDTSLKTHMPDPSTLMDMDKGALRLAKAVQRGETIGLFGDYDVDGGTGTATMARYLRQLGAEPVTYIPDRRKEGYGPSPEAFAAMVEQGAGLIVTIDCGTTSTEALEWAAGKGIDVIVVDHHLPNDNPPPTHALINPKRADDTSGLDYLSAAGVAFLLAVGLNRTLRQDGFFEGNGPPEPKLMNLVDLTALGTVCDVVPLEGLNRAFVMQGLKVMQAKGNMGIAALEEVAKTSGKPSTYHLGFLIGPRINAGGRLGPAGLALKLLSTDDALEAKQIARELDALNVKRRAVEQGVQDEAMLMAQDQVERGARVIVVAGQGWHEGVVGIVAGRLKERFGFPAIALSLSEDGTAKGSGRSINGVDLGGAIVSAVDAKLLIRGGGHGMAAGMTVARDRIEELISYLHGVLGHSVDEARSHVALRVDGLVGLGAVNEDLSDAIALAGPYGAGNSEPRVVCPRVTVVMADRVGADHVRCILSDDAGNRMKGIAFRCADTGLGALLMEGAQKPIHVVGRIKDDYWKGRRQVQLQIEDAAVA